MNLEPSVSPQEVIGLFRAALQRQDWIYDKASDQFPRAKDRNNSGGSDNVDQDKKRRLSNSLAASLGQQSAAKRQRASDSGDC